MENTTTWNRRTRLSHARESAPQPDQTNRQEDPDAPGETEEEPPVSSTHATRGPTQSAAPATAPGHTGNHGAHAHMQPSQESALPGRFLQTALGNQFLYPPAWEQQPQAPDTAYLGEGWWAPNYGHPSLIAPHVDEIGETQTSGSRFDDSPMSTIAERGRQMGMVCCEP